MIGERVQFLRDRIAGHFLPQPPAQIGVAVSGGSDSMALLLLLHDWALEDGPRLFAVTVDHGLRPEAKAEAQQVADFAASLGVSHDILHWQGWDGSGNLPDQARRARYSLIRSWAEERGIAHVALGHTADDQAETFLMRLAREAGVDGLSAMTAARRCGRVMFHRPVLHVTRQELRDVLSGRNVAWIDDPTNDDDAYERTRARNVLAELAPLGISAKTLSTVAHHMSGVRETLYWYVFLSARDIVEFQAGDILMDRRKFRVLQREISRRLLQAALNWISGSEYAPRGRAMELLLESLRGGTGMTLHGCRVLIEDEYFRVTREHEAVADLRVPVGGLWDGRWRLIGPVEAGGTIEIGALGEAGLGQCTDRKATGLPKASLVSGPAVWKGDELLAAPLAGHANGWQAKLEKDSEEYFAAFLSH